MPIRVGTAGWSVPRAVADQFPATGSQLQRYGARLAVGEINSSFYRPHRASTYLRWAQSVPNGFRFSIKLPKIVTHERRLGDVGEPIDRFLEEIAGLGETLGPVLIQLPPSLAFDAAPVGGFIDQLRSRFEGALVCEPRHPSWFEGDADTLLEAAHIARVAAHPARVPRAARPGGWPGLAYFRLHGSPRLYYSGYGSDYLHELAGTLTEAAAGAEVWCMFDNTASGAAAADALALQALLTGRVQGRSHGSA